MTIRASTRNPSPSVGRCLRRIDEIGDHPHALLFDAERRDLGEAGRLDHAHAAVQRRVAAPMFQQHRVARMDFHRVAREHVDLDFQIAAGSPNSTSGVPGVTTAALSWNTRSTRPSIGE